MKVVEAQEVAMEKVRQAVEGTAAAMREMAPMVMAVEAAAVVAVAAMVMEVAAKVRVKPVTAAATAVSQAVRWVVHVGAVLEEVVATVATQNTRCSCHSYRTSIWWAKAGYVLRTTKRTDAVAAQVATRAAPMAAMEMVGALAPVREGQMAAAAVVWPVAVASVEMVILVAGAEVA